MRLALLAGILVRPAARRRRRDSPAHAQAVPARASRAHAGAARRVRHVYRARESRRAATAARSTCSWRACRPSASTRRRIRCSSSPAARAPRPWTCTQASSAPFDRVRRDRDIVLVDQRGTGRSHRLDCDYGDQNVFERIDEVEVGPENIQCRDELSKTSDLRLYTTSIAVKDLDAVRAAWAMSASISTAIPMARAWRSTTRAVTRKPRARVILDGVVNPEMVLGPAIAIDAERALERILARCTADASCAKAFTDPSADYRALRARLTRKPEPATMVATPDRPAHSISISRSGISPPCCALRATTTTRPPCCRCRCTWRRTRTTSCRSPASSACSRVHSTKRSPTACTTAWPAARTRR